MKVDSFFMVDIETLNTSQDYPCITQIGVCYAEKGDEGIWRYYSVGGSCAMPDTHAIDKKTLLWWTEQEGFAEMLKGSLEAEVGPVELFDDCVADICYQKNIPKGKLANSFLAANPPSFDIAMLRRRFRIEKKTFPFHFSKEIDYRTLKNVHFDARGMAEEQMANLGEGGVRHDAMYDATLQARAMTIIFDSISA